MERVQIEGWDAPRVEGVLKEVSVSSDTRVWHMKSVALILRDVNFMPWTNFSCILALFLNLELLHFRHPP